MFGGIYKHRWTSTFSDADVVEIEKQQWEAVLEGLSTEQMHYAIDVCRNTMEWAPSCATFKRIALGIPSTTQALLEVHDHMRYLRDCAAAYRFSHPIVEDAYRSIGGDFTYKQTPAIDYKRMFEGAYNGLVDKFLLEWC